MRYLKMAGFVALILVLFFLSSFLVSLVAGTFFLLARLLDGDPLDMLELSETLEGFLLNNTTLISAASAILAFLFFLLVFLARKDGLFRYSRLVPTPGTHLGLALAMGAGIYFFLRAFLVLTDLPRFFPEHQELMELIFMESNLLLLIASVGIIVPIVEEVMLRGIILNRLREDLPLAAALILHALVFGFIHMNVLQGGYAFVGGLLLGLVYIWSKSLWIPIAVHIGWNSSSVLLGNVEFSLPLTLITMIAGTLVLAGAMSYFYMQSRVKV